MSFLNDYQQMVQDMAAPADAAMQRVQQFDESLREALSQMLFELQSMEHNIDGFKKQIYYGKAFDPDLLMAEVPDEIKAPIDKVFTDPARTHLFHAALGIASESIELLKAILATEIDVTNIGEELGDTAWYVALGAAACGKSLEHVLEANLKKLRRRYGSRWSQAAALDRNLSAEEQILRQALTDSSIGKGGR